MCDSLSWASISSGLRLKNITHEFEVRESFIEKFGFSVLTDAAIKLIAGYQPIVEVGAGSGYWAYELQKHGVIVHPTDPCTGRYRDVNEHWEKWIQVENLTGVEAVRKYPQCTLMTVWPDLSSWAAETLAAFKAQHVIYVGEGNGGCTGDEAFHTSLSDGFQHVETLPLPVFFGIHDRLEVWKRR